MKKKILFIVFLVINLTGLTAQDIGLLWGLKFGMTQDQIYNIVKMKRETEFVERNKKKLVFRNCTVGGIKDAEVTFEFKKDKLNAISVVTVNRIEDTSLIFEMLSDKINLKYGEPNHYSNWCDVFYEGDGYGIEEIRMLKMEDTILHSDLKSNNKSWEIQENNSVCSIRLSFNAGIFDENETYYFINYKQK